MREAVTLGDRLIMLNFRGEIIEDMQIDLPRPRDFTAKPFLELYAQLVSRFHTMQAEDGYAKE